jgi:hypothetical protein
MAQNSNPTRRDEIMAFICDYAGGKDGPTPSINEIAHDMGMAYATAYHHVMKLIIEGRLKQEDSKLCVVGAEWYAPAEYAGDRTI